MEGLDRTVKIWDMDTNKEVALKGHTEGVTSLAFSPDGKYLASGSFDGIVRIWDMDTFKEVALKGHTEEVISIAFSYDGKYLASGSFDKTIKIWDIDPWGFGQAVLCSQPFKCLPPPQV